MIRRGLRPWMRAVALLATVLVFWGCGPQAGPDLLQIVDVAPREVEVGDTIEVLGIGLEVADVKSATVLFSGELRRPGQEPIALAEPIAVTGAKSAIDKVSFTFTEALQNKFCGSGDEAAHTTFVGDVTVVLEGATGGRGQGRVVGTQIDFRPPSARRVVMAARTKQGTAALAFLGIALCQPDGPCGPGEDHPPDGGLRVGAVTAASPADRAGIRDGDVLVSFDGVSVKAVTDVVPRPGAKLVEIATRRSSATGGDAAPVVRQVSIEGFEAGGLPSDLLGAIVVLAIAAAILLIFMAPTAGIITWVERRVSARMQSRVGPNRAGPQGFLVWIADGLKSIAKEDIIPTESDQTLFRLAPYLVFVGVSATFVVMPFGQYLIAADLDIGILFVIAVTSLVAIGLMTGGWASNNKWSLLGGIRAAAQVISYEIPAAVAIVCIVMMTGSLRMQDIIAAQGGMPWDWYAFRNPVTFALFMLFFTTALAEGNRAPFDLPEAESELVAGYSTEYSGMRYLFFFFAEWANVFVFCGIATALFLGGWQVPGLSPSDQEASFPLQLLGTFMFLLKAWILIFIVIWIRWTLPRVRIDQLMNLCWKWFVPLSFGAFVLSALWVLATDPTPLVDPESGLPITGGPWLPAAVQTGIRLVTFGVWLALMVHFGRRVWFNVKRSKIPIHLNPFI